MRSSARIWSRKRSKMHPSTYLTHLRTKFVSHHVNDLCGRLLRGRNPEDFHKLSDDPNRRIVFLANSGTLASFLGKSGYEILLEIGHSDYYIRREISKGKTYKLVVFPQMAADLANWSNLLHLAGDVYPDIELDLRLHSVGLRTKCFEDIQLEFFAKYQYTYYESDHPPMDDGTPTDDRFFTYEKYLNSDRGLSELRAFLYHSLGVRETFRGDGFIAGPKGKRGGEELLTENRRIDSIYEAQVMDIEVELP